MTKTEKENRVHTPHQYNVAVDGKLGAEEPAARTNSAPIGSAMVPGRSDPLNCIFKIRHNILKMKQFIRL